jgi:hypothetical protein
MKRHSDPSRHRVPVAQSRSERPRAHGGNRRFVEVPTTRRCNVDTRDATRVVDRHGEHDIRLFHFGPLIVRIDRVHALLDLRREHLARSGL